MEDFAPDIQVDWVRMAQSVIRYNVVIVGKFFNKGSWVSEAWKKGHPEELEEEPEGAPERIPTAEKRREESTWTLILWVLWVCGPRARHLPTVPG